MENSSNQSTNSTTSLKKLFCGILSGLAGYIITGSMGLYLLRISWPTYAIASKDKSYTLAMLLSRLITGVLAAVCAGGIATKIANDRGKTAFLAGIIICCTAAYIHFFMVWAEYPVWYHLAYLLPIIPITVLSHYYTSKK